MSVINEMLRQIDRSLAAPKAETQLPLELLQPSPFQPRRYFDPLEHQALVTSIREHGVLQPLVVRPLEEGRYEIIAGERRFRAAREAGLATVPVAVHSCDEATARSIALLENLHRADLNPYEETLTLLDLLGLLLKRNREETVSLLHQYRNQLRGKSEPLSPEDREAIETLFARVGKLNPQSFAAHRLPLLNLPEDLQTALLEGSIPYTVALALKSIKDPQERRTLLLEAQAGLSLAELRARIRAQRPAQPASLSEAYRRLLPRLKHLEGAKAEQARNLLEKLRQLLSDSDI